MAFEAKLRDEYQVGSVTAFGGREFVKGQWRPIQTGQEVSAEAHPFLEIREVGGGLVSQEPAPVAGPVEGPGAGGAPPAPPANEADGADKAGPEELDETQGTPPEASARAAEKGKAEGGARRGKP
jgi:hypothetical protein